MKTVAAILALSLMIMKPTPSSATIIHTHVEQGDLAGVRIDGRVGAFLGIPYAQPPVGALRWQPPAPAQRWQQTFHANHFGANCEQAAPPPPTDGDASNSGPWTREYDIRGRISEDCLTLNIWTPASTRQAKLPVFLWIYGGGFTTGGTTVPIHDGAALAHKGMIVVTINYRVGLFGFLAHPELSSESTSHTSGNYGLLDQIAALRWVRANIAAFGGDPDRITIAGQSAGAASVDHLIATPLARGLFAQAISESGSALGMPIATLAQAEARGKLLAQLAGARSIAELRALPAARLADAVEKIPHPVLEPRFSPIIDGYVFPDASYIDADTNDTPILTGMTANETTGTQPMFGKATQQSLEGEVRHTFGASADDFASTYGLDRHPEPNAVREAIGRDRGLAALALWANARTRRSASAAYLYLWSHVEPGPSATRFRAYHASEIAYAFDNLDKVDRPFATTDRELARLTSDYWANFVKTGDPNGPNLPRWPRYDPVTRAVMKLDTTPSMIPIMSPNKLDFYRRFQANGGKLGLFYLYPEP